MRHALPPLLRELLLADHPAAASGLSPFVTPEPNSGALAAVARRSPLGVLAGGRSGRPGGAVYSICAAKRLDRGAAGSR